MDGLHLTADLYGCRPTETGLLLETARLRRLCLDLVRQSGLQAVAELFHQFSPAPGTRIPTHADAISAGQPAGITGVVLLAESHLAVHTWPEIAAVTLDVYVCNFAADNSVRAERLLQGLLKAFAPEQVHINRLPRGGAVFDKP